MPSRRPRSAAGSGSRADWHHPRGRPLLTDATALVALNTAIASITATVAWYVVGHDFIMAAGGGVLIGLIFFFVIGFVRKDVTDPVIDSSLTS